MTATYAWTLAGTARLHGLSDGPCEPVTARYDLAGGGAVYVDLEMPLGPPASAGKTVLMLPAPSGGEAVAMAHLDAGDGVEILTVRFDPPEAADESGTWQVTVSAPDPAPVTGDSPQDVVLRVGGRDYPCDVLRDPDHDSGGITAWFAVPRETLPRDLEGMTVTAAVLPAGSTVILNLPEEP